MVVHEVSAQVANGIVAMPIKYVTLKLDSIGYEGWWVNMRTNPRSEHYDMFLDQDQEKSWKGLSHLILDWNFGDEDGNKLPLPKDGLRRQELPFQVLVFLYNKYIEAFNEETGFPKAQESNSSDT